MKHKHKYTSNNGTIMLKLLVSLMSSASYLTTVLFRIRSVDSFNMLFGHLQYHNSWLSKLEQGVRNPQKVDTCRSQHSLQLLSWAAIHWGTQDSDTSWSVLSLYLQWTWRNKGSESLLKPIIISTDWYQNIPSVTGKVWRKLFEQQSLS